MSCSKAGWTTRECFPWQTFGTTGLMWTTMNNINRWSKNFDERPHHISCRYWAINDPFHCMLLLTTEWSLLQQRLPMLFNGPDNHQKLSLPTEGSGSPSNTWFLVPSWASPQMASRSVQIFLQGSPVCPTDRQTDRPRYVWHMSQKAASMQCIWCGLITL